ncbi:hypothetical protein Bca52824_022555 [Brassica carinata]|uniref:Uncharacterized protein n=1 Tax=Brassica carinata TaxID=52824 RepID=A0A8X7VG89_BRACI|nr:hypothetical protein Bca52824_022555 [Brassica carinata]
MCSSHLNGTLSSTSFLSASPSRVPDWLEHTHCLFLEVHPREHHRKQMDTSIRRHGQNMRSASGGEETHTRLERVHGGA